MVRDDVTGRDLSLKLGDEIEDVLRDLGVSVKKVGRRKLYCFAPWANETTPKLEVDIWSKPGKWNHWRGGHFGDALGLVACVLVGRGDAGRDREAVKQAIFWAKERYGLGTGYDRGAWKRETEERQKRAKEREARAARELAEARNTARGLWLASRPIERGDAADAYLQARGIVLWDLPRQPRAMRLQREARWFDDDGELAHVGPAIASAMTLVDGKFGSLHRIWIDPNRPGEKADLPIVRKMWPESEACAIRLWRGASNLTEAEAAKDGQKEEIVLCEGVEDGLSIALMVPERRIHAVGSLPGLLSYAAPKCASGLTVCADNDWGKPQAQAMLDRACARFERELRLPVRIARSPVGKDFNDLLRGRA
jgi:hypothetical protein